MPLQLSDLKAKISIYHSLDGTLLTGGIWSMRLRMTPRIYSRCENVCMRLNLFAYVGQVELVEVVQPIRVLRC